MNQNVEYKFLDWDTEYFGEKSAKINMLKEINEQDQIDIMNYSSKFDFIVISNLNNINKNNRWLGENTTAFLTDTNIQLSKPIVKTEAPISEHISISKNFSSNKEILDISSKSFITSRFLNDPYLSTEKSQLIYHSWTKNAFNKKNKYFAVYREGSKVMGYLLFNLSQSNCIVELIAVSQEAQGKSVGSKLIKAIEKYSMNNKILSIQVGTQINNIPAIRLYTKLGFKYTSLSSIYHWWPKKG